MIREDFYADYCRKRQELNRFRALQGSVILTGGRVERDGVKYVNLSGNDYLGLSQHPALAMAACACVETCGVGTTASRLVTGNHPLYEKIEAKVANAKGKESALVLAAGYQANLSVLSALADAKVVGSDVAVVADRLSHHSLLQGAQLSGARVTRYRHNDYGHLESLLKSLSSKGAFCIVVSESVFGMDGDCADLLRLGDIADSYGALLYIDEAHATGVAGKNGFGLAADCPGKVDVVMGTFGKALGSFGSYIACSSSIRDYLVQSCGGLVYSTALPPAVLGSIDAALDMVPDMEQERAYLRKVSDRLRSSLRAQGWDCGQSSTQIVPVIVGSETAALELSAALLHEGFLAPAIRPPTVPAHGSRLRLSLSAAHAADDIERLIVEMNGLAPRYAKRDVA